MVRSLAWFRQKANRDEVSHLDLTVETPTPAEGAVGCHDILIKVITLNCDIQMTATSFESKHLFSDASSKLPIFLIATNNNLLKPFVLLFFSLPPKKINRFLGQESAPIYGRILVDLKGLPFTSLPWCFTRKAWGLDVTSQFGACTKGSRFRGSPGRWKLVKFDVVYIYIRKKPEKKRWNFAENMDHPLFW